MDFATTDFKFAIYFHPLEILLTDLNTLLLVTPYLLNKNVNFNPPGEKFKFQDYKYLKILSSMWICMTSYI